MKGEELKNIPTSSQYTGALTFSNEHLKVHRKPKQSNFSKEQAWQKLLIQPYHSIAVTTHRVSQLTSPIWNPSCWGKGYSNLSLYLLTSLCHSFCHFQEISAALPPACAICRVTFRYSQLTLPSQTKWGSSEVPSQTLQQWVDLTFQDSTSSYFK